MLFWAALTPVLAIHPTYAQAPPFPLEPLKAPIELRLIAGAESKCIKTTREGIFGKFQKDGKVTNVSMSVNADNTGTANLLNLQNVSNGVTAQLQVPLAADGRQISQNDPEIQFYPPLSESDQAKLKPLLAPVVTFLIDSINTVLATPLTQGQTVNFPNFDFCKFFTGQSSASQHTPSRIVGTTVRKTRTVVVLETDYEVNGCSVKDLQFGLKGKMWSTYDVVSGLPSDSFLTMSLQMSARSGAEVKEIALQMSEAQDCEVTSPVLAKSLKNTAATDASEKKLRELKSLYNKGLIDKERYDQRVQSILRDF